ncbi:hypothetical protein FKG94_27090 [Exilibacterium tricleocarpae]|uniref:Uncharacterized protein n=1 Tax=Exilibacterium tricleocarpae TaxID=2591008 RepID=A0A545SNG3_9GAMM|nr:hypothetical protein [Exilibacterium tricleocarpae]TQV66501.1 hypothetical protein FKG94_27090 [Exilibacterium tricleocarpae]
MSHHFNQDENDYRGPERRFYQRRQLKDRRQSIRFELLNGDRRQNNGRRGPDLDHWRQYEI